MTATRMRQLANASALFFVACGLASLAEGMYGGTVWPFQAALLLLLAAFASIQLRIRAGGRTARTPLLYIHIAFALPFLLSIAALAFVARPIWLLYSMAALGACAGATGSIVFARPAPTKVDS